jgi:hypothetical protein
MSFVPPGSGWQPTHRLKAVILQLAQDAPSTVTLSLSKGDSSRHCVSFDALRMLDPSTGPGCLVLRLTLGDCQGRMLCTLRAEEAR